jgi:hypothetical protein
VVLAVVVVVVAFVAAAVIVVVVVAVVEVVAHCTSSQENICLAVKEMSCWQIVIYLLPL